MTDILHALLAWRSWAPLELALVAVAVTVLLFNLVDLVFDATATVMRRRRLRRAQGAASYVNAARIDRELEAELERLAARVSGAECAAPMDGAPAGTGRVDRPGPAQSRVVADALATERFLTRADEAAYGVHTSLVATPELAPVDHAGRVIEPWLAGRDVL
jgi:hypothetical protein